MSDFTKAELQQAVQEASERATEKVLAKLGFDTSNPFELQKDMAYLRQQRESSEAVAGWIKWGIISVFITGLATTVWLGLQQALKG